MEFKVKEDPSILMEYENGTNFLTMAEEEVFAILNTKTKQMISFDFEKRKLASRCIVRYIDYGKGEVAEVKAVAPRFNIKSTFAPTPYSNSDITFLGGGFTASAVAREGRISIVSSVPEISLPDGRKGLKVEAHMDINGNQKSFNCLISYKNKREALHASLSEEVEGIIWIGENKFTFSGADLQGRHIWKRTTFSNRKEKPIAVIYGKTNDKPFSSVALTYDNSFSITLSGESERVGNIRWNTIDKDTIEISDGDKVNIKAKVFSSIHETKGPFRKARTFRYAVFEGFISGRKIEEGVGYLEYPDDYS